MIPDLIGGLGPEERIQILVMDFQVLRDGVLEGERAAIRPAPGCFVGDLGDSALQIAGLARSYELEDPCGFESVSRANQAAALERISRSIRSRRTSRRSRASSLRSDVLRPSLRRPESTSA